MTGTQISTSKSSNTAASTSPCESFQAKQPRLHGSCRCVAFNRRQRNLYTHALSVPFGGWEIPFPPPNAPEVRFAAPNPVLGSLNARGTFPVRRRPTGFVNSTSLARVYPRGADITHREKYKCYTHRVPQTLGSRGSAVQLPPRFVKLQHERGNNVV